MAKKKGQKLNKGSAGQNRKNSEAFLEKFRLKSGVKETESGLLYLIVEEGEGIAPESGDTVIVHQRISLTNNNVVADTYKTGLPEKFTLAEAIPGLREGLMLMNVGSRAEFALPPELAWGKRGAANKIGPNAVLIVDLKLVDIEIS